MSKVQNIISRTVDNDVQVQNYECAIIGETKALKNSLNKLLLFGRLLTGSLPIKHSSFFCKLQSHLEYGVKSPSHTKIFVNDDTY